MSEKNFATYSVDGRDAIDSIRQAGIEPPMFGPAQSAHIRPFPSPAVERQVEEDREFYIPDLLSSKHFDAHRELHVAAAEHATNLHRAQHSLHEAFNLVRVLKASVENEGDSRAMQTDTVLNVIEKKLNKALRQIDKHEFRHTNLFLAYFASDAGEDAD